MMILQDHYILVKMILKCIYFLEVDVRFYLYLIMKKRNNILLWSLTKILGNLFLLIMKIYFRMCSYIRIDEQEHERLLEYSYFKTIISDINLKPDFKIVNSKLYKNDCGSTKLKILKFIDLPCANKIFQIIQ